GTAGSETGTSVRPSVRPSVPRGRLRARPCPCPCSAVPRWPLPPRPPSRPHHCRCKSAAPRPVQEHRLRSNRAPGAERERGPQPQHRAAPAGLQPHSPRPAVPPALPVSARPRPSCIPRGARGEQAPPPHTQRALVRSSGGSGLSLRRFRPSALRRAPPAMVSERRSERRRESAGISRERHPRERHPRSPGIPRERHPGCAGIRDRQPGIPPLFHRGRESRQSARMLALWGLRVGGMRAGGTNGLSAAC
ncbi:hypothetical protein Nmel_017166, partial [Mimus melanotis]